MRVTPVALLLGCTAIINLWIGIYVYRKAPKAGLNRAFGFMATTISVWTAAVALVHYGSLPRILTGRFAFASGSLIPLAVMTFIARLRVPNEHRVEVVHRFFSGLALALCGLSLSPWLVVSVTLDSDGSGLAYGPLHSVYAAYVVLCFAYSLYLLTLRYRTSTGLAKLQIRYLVFAFLISSVLATVTNLVIPLVLGITTLTKYGPFFSLLLLALIGHAIIRHRLMDMRVVVKRSVVYLAAFVAAGVILILLLLVSSTLIRDQHHAQAREIVLALAVAVLFSPLKTRIQLGFERYLYREPYDYQRTVREASGALAETIDMPVLLGYIANLITRTLKPTCVSIFLLEEDQSGFTLAAHSGCGQASNSLALSSALVCKVVQAHEAIFLDEVADAPETPGASDLRDEFKRLGAEVVVPLVEEEQVIGVLCIGPKRSGDPYFSDDADLLTTLANQSAVAIRNAQTHQRVVQVNEELRKILSTIKSGVIAVGAKGKIALFNRAAEQLTGVAVQSACGQVIEDLPAPLARLITSTVRDGQSRSQEEFALPDAAGQLVPLVCSTSPLLNPQGAIIGAVAVLADLSRLKELEQEKRRAERLASLEAIASGMVHEIRNPLVSLKTFTQLMPLRFHDEEFREAFSRVADREIRRIDELLTRFRTLASASAQPMEPVDISGPLDDTLETLLPRLEEHRVRLRRVADGTPRQIIGNASQLEQLFLNLCLNAIEAMEPGGELTVRVADLCEGGGTTLLVEISDTGNGIPEELRASIFNPFVTTKAHGTGLGLAICRSITDAHHARLSARNNVGRPGSTFTIEFPVPVGVARVRP